MRMPPDTWITVVGIGDDGMDGLSPVAWAVIEQADILFGGQRHLGFLHEDSRPHYAWKTPFKDSLVDIEAHQAEKIVILASGDPNWYGVAKSLVNKFGIENVSIIPGISSFSLAAARLGWGLQDVVTTSCHGRDIDSLTIFFTPGRHILTLTGDGKSPNQIATLLRQRGCGPSDMAIFTHMGGEKEEFLVTTAEDFPDIPLPDLNIVAIAISFEAGAYPLSTVPGLPDDVYISDGQLTKREVRAVTLAALKPLPGQILWDIGAGCGSIGIEWLRTFPESYAYAIEKNPDRVGFIRQNARSLGVPDLEIINGDACSVLEDLPDPDAVFIGGGLTIEQVFEAAWPRLKGNGGRLVANAVTTEGEARLQSLQSLYGGELIRMAISRVEPVGPFHAWKPSMPVTQWRIHKRES